MMNFIILTLSITVAMVLSFTILTAGFFVLMGNRKVNRWLTRYYTKQIDTTCDYFTEDLDKEVGAK